MNENIFEYFLLFLTETYVRLNRLSLNLLLLLGVLRFTYNVS